MKLWIRVVLFITFSLMPTPNIEFTLKVDFNNDDKTDLIVTRDGDGVGWVVNP